MAEWSIAHAWKACKPHGFMGSNPIPSTIHQISKNVINYHKTNLKPFKQGFNRYFNSHTLSEVFLTFHTIVSRLVSRFNIVKKIQGFITRCLQTQKYEILRKKRNFIELLILMAQLQKLIRMDQNYGGIVIALIIGQL